MLGYSMKAPNNETNFDLPEVRLLQYLIWLYDIYINYILINPSKTTLLPLPWIPLPWIPLPSLLLPSPFSPPGSPAWWPRFGFFSSRSTSSLSICRTPWRGRECARCRRSPPCRWWWCSAASRCRTTRSSSSSNLTNPQWAVSGFHGTPRSSRRPSE